MGTDTREREQLKKAYDSKDWARKVDKMSNAQVTAIYLRLKKQNRI